MKSSILIALTFGLFGAFSFEVKAQTLQEAVCAMLEYEPELNASEYDTLSAREDHRLNRSRLLPQISLRSSAGVNERDRSTDGLLETGDTLLQRDVGVSIRQLLYDGGSTMKETKASRNAFLAQQHLEKGIVEGRVVDLCEVYLEVLRTERQVELANRNYENHRRMRDLLKERADAGGSRADLALTQGRLGLAADRLATSKLALRLAKGRFERLTGRAPTHLSHPSVPTIPNAMGAVDLSANHDYMAAAEALKAAQFRAKASTARRGPDVYLEGNATRGADRNGVRGDDNEVSGLVVASWSLYNGGYNKSAERRARLQVGKYEELLRAADIDRNYNLDVIWQQRQGSLASVRALELYAKELEGVTEDYQEQFKVGRQELLSILDVQSEAFSAESQLLDARLDLAASAFRILGLQGRATGWILNGSACEDCLHGDKSVASAKAQEGIGFDLVDPDQRVPVTQGHLMNNRFEAEGPETAHESLHQTYYVEKPQLPFTPSAKSKPKGGFFRILRPSPVTTTKDPIFK